MSKHGSKEAIQDPKEKETNPKGLAGMRKPPMSCLPMAVLMEVGVGMLEGALKYGRHNYRVSGCRASTYYDGTMRHLNEWWEGEDLDPDSGLSHISKAISSLIVLRDSMIQGKFNDDRPPKVPDDFLADLQDKTTAVLKKYPEAVEPWTEQRLMEVGGGQAKALVSDVLFPSTAMDKLAELNRSVHNTDVYEEEPDYDVQDMVNEMQGNKKCHHHRVYKDCHLCAGSIPRCETCRDCHNPNECRNEKWG